MQYGLLGDEDYRNVQSLQHIKYIHRISIHYVFLHAIEYDKQRQYHIASMHRFFSAMSYVIYLKMIAMYKALSPL